MARPGAGCGCLVAGLAGLALFLAGVFAFTTLVVEGSRPLPGDASRFDPVAAFPAIVPLAGEGARLQRIDATFVRADGTLDLTAGYTPSPGVEYHFLRPVPAPAVAPPVGAGGRPGEPWFVPVTVDAARPWRWKGVSRSSGGVRTRYQFVDLGLTRRERAAEPGRTPLAPPPLCSFAALWNTARERGAPQDAVATIRYDASGYLFEIRGTGVRLRFGLDCAPVGVSRER